MRLNTELTRVTLMGGEKHACLVNDNHETTVVVDEILMGVGRTPNVEGLNLEAAGVEYDHEHGILVNDYLQTSNRRIYAAGEGASCRATRPALTLHVRVFIPCPDQIARSATARPPEPLIGSLCSEPS